MVMYFSRYLTVSTTTTCFAVVMKFLGKYMPMYLSFHVRKEQPICDKITFVYVT